MPFARPRSRIVVSDAIRRDGQLRSRMADPGSWIADGAVQVELDGGQVVGQVVGASCHPATCAMMRQWLAGDQVVSW